MCAVIVEPSNCGIRYTPMAVLGDAMINHWIWVALFSKPSSPSLKCSQTNYMAVREILDFVPWMDDDLVGPFCIVPKLKNSGPEIVNIFRDIDHPCSTTYQHTDLSLNCRLVDPQSFQNVGSFPAKKIIQPHGFPNWRPPQGYFYSMVIPPLCRPKANIQIHPNPTKNV